MPLTLERIERKEVTVGVIGLGYVGLPLSLLFAEAGIPTFAFDIDREKIDHLLAGKSYINTLADERIAQLVNEGRLLPTAEMELVSKCDAVMICVPTPLTPHLEPDLSYIISTCKTIAPHLKPHTLVSLESTSWPGTTEEVVLPILGREIYLCFSPEREDPGNSTYESRSIPKLVGGVDEITTQIATALYQLAFTTVIPVKGTRIAEASKLLENIFRGVNIALVNELKVILHRMGIDVWEVIQAAATKPFGYMPFWPGPGLGGHCIPIDPFYLSWKAKEFGLSTRFIELAGEINRWMPEWVVDRVQDRLNDLGLPLKGSRILILGLAYKADLSDLRESPSLKLIELLQQKGAKVEYNDPFFPEIPKTRDYGNLKGKKSCDLSKMFDLLLLATAHSAYCPEKILNYGVPIVDTRNFFPSHELVSKA